ncbi:hypothetical protein [Luteimonas fraxinea]|uniref:Uncharacterized protein n=1 Tax=Luteimonas fraxinea TaxID=2901869 RepID=A0ABS8UDM5_9GAMM|nr:hypothetical protein [Luteimonas fraxinea]MCD9097087.1 hypothetical protein [Luteimonas fraxinea]
MLLIERHAGQVTALPELVRGVAAEVQVVGGLAQVERVVVREFGSILHINGPQLRSVGPSASIGEQRSREMTNDRDT